MDKQANIDVKIEANVFSPATKALSDGSREETPRLTYKHKWTIRERLTLSMLAESYSNNWDEKLAVFNHFHKSDLRRVGGLRKAVVVTQFNDMRKRFNAVDALKELQASLSPYDRSKLVSQAKLQKKALDIGIRLQLRETMDNSNQNTMLDTPDAQGCKKRKRVDMIDEPPQNLTLLPKTPNKEEGNGPMTPPDSREHKIPRFTADKKLAQIGFRAFTAESQGTSTSLGIRAGAFLNCPTIPLARNLEATKYHNEALHHITKVDHSRPSMFISTTKNPMRALHMLLHAPQGEKTLILIDLNVADAKGNVQKAHHLKLKTKFRYTGAGEYLIFGGVEPKAIISQVPLSRLLSDMPTTPESDDPFGFRLLQSKKVLSHARQTIRKKVLPMTYSLGKALGELVGKLGIPPELFESGVWSFVQDYKFYNAEGGTKTGRHWSENVPFKHGAVQGYQSATSTCTSAREIVEIPDDSGSDQTSDSDFDSVLSDEDGPIPIEVEDWVKDTQRCQSPDQPFNDFLAELRDMASPDYNDPGKNDDTMMDVVELSERSPQSIAPKPPSCSPRVDTGAVIEGGLAAPLRHDFEKLENIRGLCADVMRMHGDGGVDLEFVADKSNIAYEFGWTGM